MNAHWFVHLQGHFTELLNDLAIAVSSFKELLCLRQRATSWWWRNIFSMVRCIGGKPTASSASLIMSWSVYDRSSSLTQPHQTIHSNKNHTNNDHLTIASMILVRCRFRSDDTAERDATRSKVRRTLIVGGDHIRRGSEVVSYRERKKEKTREMSRAKGCDMSGNYRH